MIFTVNEFIERATAMLRKWENGLEQIENGTYKFDGSMPEDCIKSMHEHKIKVYKEVINFLSESPKNKIVATDRGLTDIGSTYYKMVNQ